jgi:hypothetical protein
MKERGWIEPSWIAPIVERVVGQAVDGHAAQLTDEIVRRVMEEIAAEAPAADPGCGATSASGTEELARSVAEIQMGSSQREILRALLDTSARYASRVALFVVKGSHATGWQARGFASNDAVKDFALDENAPAVVRAMSIRAMDGRLLASAPVADLDACFLQDFGMPASGEGCILPLILKDKVAALVYADGGTDAGGRSDEGALELLVMSTSAWLEVNSLRKLAHKGTAHAYHPDESTYAVPAAELQSSQASQPAEPPAYNDPFAVHTRGQAMAAAAAGGEIPLSGDRSVVEASPIDSPETEADVAESTIFQTTISDDLTVEGMNTITESQSAVVEMEPALVEPLPLDHGPLDHGPLDHGSFDHGKTETAPLMPPISSISPEDQDIHRKAQRFARLLVDEIKLYNQAKVADGRKNHDLYDRLQDTIEKSRATYQKRYGNTVAASADYFQHEIIRSLAEDDLSIMGADFRH